MPVEICMLNGKPGFKFGQFGRCYTYNAGDSTARKNARAKALKQGQAIKSSQNQKKEITNV